MRLDDSQLWWCLWLPFSFSPTHLHLLAQPSPAKPSCPAQLDEGQSREKKHACASLFLISIHRQSVGRKRHHRMLIIMSPLLLFARSAHYQHILQHANRSTTTGPANKYKKSVLYSSSSSSSRDSAPPADDGRGGESIAGPASSMAL